MLSEYCRYTNKFMNYKKLFTLVMHVGCNLVAAPVHSAHHLVVSLLTLALADLGPVVLGLA